VKEKNRCLVVKFGGASLGDGARILKAIKAVSDEVKNGTKVAVVVSAIGKTTDNLIETAKQACGSDVSVKELDDILSMGERTSARVFTAGLRECGVETRYFDPADDEWPIITDEAFNNAKPAVPLCEELVQRHVQPVMERGVVPVIPGFIGKTKDGSITTLGRGGSDTTAFILGKALKADQIVLVTSVEGIMTADPKVVSKPRVLREIGVEALAGLADSDVKFIHKKALKYKDPSIDVKVIDYNAGRLDSEGTIIHGGLPKELAVDVAYERPVVAVTIVGKALADSPKVLSRVVEEVRKVGASNLGMSTNADSLILYLPEENASRLLEALHTVVLEHHSETLALAARRNLAFIKVRGVGLEETPGVIGSIAGPLHENAINIAGILTITSSILVFVDWVERERVIKLVQEALREGKR